MGVFSGVSAPSYCRGLQCDKTQLQALRASTSHQCTTATTTALVPAWAVLLLLVLLEVIPPGT